MLTELRNRGLEDALIVCCDGLKGLPGGDPVTWPEATVQTCVVHMVRNSLRYSLQEALGADHHGDAARSTPRRPSRPPKRASREFAERVGGRSTLR